MTRYSIDTRTLQPGDYYVAIRGERYDGHDFIFEAIDKGAAGLIIEQYPQERDIPGRVKLSIVRDAEEHLAREAKLRLQVLGTQVIAITGSVGKTTTKRAVVSVVEQVRPVVTPKGNFNTLLGISLTVMNELTSPDQKLVVEMGTYQVGNIARLCRYIQPSIAVVTNVQPAHLERMGSLENIAQAKGEIVEALPPTGTACLNADDPRVHAMSDRTAARKLLYGISPDADIRPDRITATIPMLGQHSIYTALAAFSVGAALSLSDDVINAGIANIPQEKGRLNRLQGVNGITLIDDTYNAAPISTLSALGVLADLPASRRIAFLGDMLELGSEEAAGHQAVLRRALEVCDLLILVGPRMQAAHTTLDAGTHATLFETSDAVVAPLRDGALYQPQSGDVVLVKGSAGIRMEKISKHLLDSSIDPASVLVRQEANWQDA